MFDLLKDWQNGCGGEWESQKLAIITTQIVLRIYVSKEVKINTSQTAFQPSGERSVATLN